MISIITCSIKPEMCEAMVKSISETIEYEHEFIIVDNRGKDHGLCKVYNEAANQAKGEFLCFVHEDVIIKTKNWGIELVKFARENKECGVIGVAGGKYACKNFSSWWVNDRVVKILHDSNKLRSYREEHLIFQYVNPQNETFSEAVCIDGLFMFVKSDICKNNKFDEKTFKGFHHYDADFTLSIAQKYRNYVYFGMDVCHFSGGDTNKSFYENVYIFQKKWKKILPFCISGYKPTFKEEIYRAHEHYCQWRENGVSLLKSLLRIIDINSLYFSLHFLFDLVKHRFPDYYKPALSIIDKLYIFVTSRYDSRFLHQDVPFVKNCGHTKWRNYLQLLGNKHGMKILEIGSREVTGKSDARERFSNATYVGFDYYPGANVDVVGDAHKLSSYFAEGEKFDIIYSHAVFEHFAMPWIVAKEISKLLKVGGYVFIETHFSYGSHERPWIFFQFSDMALRVLFSQTMGFKCLEAGLSNPIVGRFSSYADEYLRNRPVAGLYCHSEYLGQKTHDVEDFDFSKIDITDLVNGTHYPKPQ